MSAITGIPFKPGDRVKWLQYHRSQIVTHTGTAIETDIGPYWKVRRDDTKRIVTIRTTRLNLIPPGP